jgi:mRNA interferase RelE/StbE
LPYSIRIPQSAARALADLDGPDRKRVAAAIDKLADNPRPYGVRSVVTQPGAYRIRVGDYRVLYEIDDNPHVVTILKIAHRSRAFDR